MPELPEVETIVRSLQPLLVGRRITGADFQAFGPGNLDRAHTLRNLIVSPLLFRRRVSGALIESIERYGKHIVFQLHNANKSNKKDRYFFLVHLGMTGQLTCENTPEFQSKHTHLVLTLDQPGRWLHYTDIRRFGRLRLTNRLGKNLTKLGPDPLEISAGEFVELLRSRRTMSKSLLLNQTFLRGIGNIYADESLFHAGIHPAAVAAQLSGKRALRLYHGIRETLLQAIELGGSSISDYVDGQGRSGYFQRVHQVYQRTGKPCYRCSSRIRKIVLASRSTHFCPRCQRGTGKINRNTERIATSLALAEKSL